MRIIVNEIAIIAFIAQLISFVFSALNQESTENTTESLCHIFIFAASLCSLLVVVIFLLQYNFHFKFLKKRIPCCIFLVIVLLGAFIHVMQLTTRIDFIPISCILLAIDCYIIRKSVGCLFSK